MPLSALQKSSAISCHRNFLIQSELLQNTKEEFRAEPEKWIQCTRATAGKKWQRELDSWQMTWQSPTTAALTIMKY